MSLKKRKEASPEEASFRSKKGFGTLVYVLNGTAYKFYEKRTTKAPKSLQTLFFLERVDEPAQKEETQKTQVKQEIQVKPEGDKE